MKEFYDLLLSNMYGLLNGIYLYMQAGRPAGPETNHITANIGYIINLKTLYDIERAHDQRPYWHNLLLLN